MQFYNSGEYVSSLRLSMRGVWLVNGLKSILTTCFEPVALDLMCSVGTFDVVATDFSPLSGITQSSSSVGTKHIRIDMIRAYGSQIVWGWRTD